MKKTGLVRLLSKNSILFLALFIITSLSIDSKAQGSNQFTGNANFILGYKILDKDDWDLADVGLPKLNEHFEWGGDIDFKMKSWPISINFGYLRSSEDKTFQGIFEGTNQIIDVDNELITSELYGGIKKIFDHLSPVCPYVTGGITRVSAEFIQEYATIENTLDDSAFGFYLGGGVYVTLMEHLNLGFNLRYSRAELEMFGKDRKAGGIHYGMMVGYHF